MEKIKPSEENIGDKLRVELEFCDMYNTNYQKEYWMGGGAFNTVYKLDDYYVMRIPRKYDLNKDDDISLHFTDEEKLEQKIAKDLNCYYGDTVAKFGKISILKNAIGDNDGLVAGIPTEIYDYQERYDYYTGKYLPQFAALPQKAYDNIAKDLKTLSQYNGLNNRKYCYDTDNPNNFIKVGDEIRVVDQIDNTSFEMLEANNDMPSLLKAFLTPNVRISTDYLFPQDFQNMKTIFKKCIIAGEKSNLDWGNTSIDTYDYNNILNYCNIKTPVSEIYDRVHGKSSEEIEKNLDEILKI